jgi:hypothetical protein
MILLALLGCFEPAPTTDDAARTRLDVVERAHAALATSVEDLGARIDATLTSLSGEVRALEARHEEARQADSARDEALAMVAARLEALEGRHADEVAALEARIVALEAENEALADEAAAARADLDDLAAEVADLRDAPPGGVSADLLALDAALSVDTAGDLLLDGINLYVRSGAGATDATPNGKGNLILGYAEGTGTELRTGSHTLVAGTGLDWRGRWGLVLGVDHVLSGDGGALLGGDANTVSGTGAVAVGGHANTVTHLDAVNAAGARRSSDVDCGFRASGTSAGSGC